MVLKTRYGGKTRFTSGFRFNLVFDQFWLVFRVFRIELWLVSNSIGQTGQSDSVQFLKPMDLIVKY